MAGQGPLPGQTPQPPTGYVKLWLKKSQIRFVAFTAAEHYAEAV